MASKVPGLGTWGSGLGLGPEHTPFALLRPTTQESQMTAGRYTVAEFPVPRRYARGHLRSARQDTTATLTLASASRVAKQAFEKRAIEHAAAFLLTLTGRRSHDVRCPHPFHIAILRGEKRRQESTSDGSSCRLGATCSSRKTLQHARCRSRSKPCCAHTRERKARLAIFKERRRNT